MSVFQFKHFSVHQANSSMKVGTDAMVLGALVQAENPKNILDIGAGTGVLSLMMAQKFPNARMTAVEIDENALLDCKVNFQNSSWSQRLELVNADILEFESKSMFDLIVSNPPFFERSLKNVNASKTRARHTDSLPIELLIKKVSSLINRNGSFWVILPLDTARILISEGSTYGLYPARMIELEGKPGNKIRMVVELRCQKTQNCREESLCIRDEMGAYTDQYKVLTSCFHNKPL